MKSIEKNEIGIDLKKLNPETKALVPKLMSEHTTTRKNARYELEDKGEAVLDDLIFLLKSKEHQLKWEALKAIENIASEKSIPVLIKQMHSSETEFRWMAAEGLVKIGRGSVLPVLELVEKSGHSPHIRTGAHHVLNVLLTDKEKMEYKNLMDALTNMNELGETSPVWASETLKLIEKGTA